MNGGTALFSEPLPNCPSQQFAAAYSSCLQVNPGNVRVPESEDEKRERKRNMHQQPAVQPVVQLCLQVHQSAVITPALQIIHFAAKILRNIQAQEAKNVVT